MSDTPAPTPMCDYALDRLRKLAEGNGLTPDKLHLFGTEETTYTIKGLMKLEPMTEHESKRYMGAAQGKGRVVVQSLAALKPEIDRRTEAFRNSHDWIPEAINQLKEQPCEGWGLDDVKITLPGKSTILAASDTCPTCHGVRALPCPQCGGQGYAPCPACRGMRYEICYGCNGTGMTGHGQACAVCSGSNAVVQNGVHYITCRSCNGIGQSTCPACRSTRTIACDACKGAGAITEEIKLSCAARTHFTITSEGAPPGLRRGLDRLGIVNLTKGHADIVRIETPPKNDADAPLPPPMFDENGQSIEQTAQSVPKPPDPEIHYEATLPYGELRMDFNGKKAIVSVFGKRNIILNLPAFLDVAVEPSREALRAVAAGTGNLESALTTRIVRDAVTLQATGKGGIKEFRHIYPLGLSSQAASDILTEARRALNRTTQQTRSIVAILSVLLSGVLFGGLFLTPLHNTLITVLPDVLADFMPFVAALGLNWLALSVVTHHALQKKLAEKLPGLNIPLWQKTGKIGYTMLGVITLSFVITLMLAPEKSDWLTSLLAFANHAER